MSNEETNKTLKEDVSTLNEKEPSIEKTSDAIASDAPISNEIFKAKPKVKQLDEILPEGGTNLLYISGTLAGHDYDCEGPIEFPFKLDKPMWPLTPIQPNPNYKHQRFDYDGGTWIAIDAKSQGQQITDLCKKVAALQEDSASHDKSADQTQQMGMQLTKSMALLTTKLSTMEGKLDTLLNTKDGDK